MGGGGPVLELAGVTKVYPGTPASSRTRSPPPGSRPGRGRSTGSGPGAFVMPA